MLDIWIPSYRFELAKEAQNTLFPYEAKIYDGTGYESFSKLINHCIKNSENEIIIIVSDKVRATPELINKTIKLLNEGYGLVGLWRFAFFGFKKDLIRKIGWFDERFIGGGYEDNDFILRMKEANIAYYATEEAPYNFIPTSWSYSQSRDFYYKKWNVSNFPDYIIRTLNEEIYDYKIKEKTIQTEFLQFKDSITCKYSDEKWISMKIKSLNYYAEFETDKYILEECFPEYIGTMAEIGAGPTVVYSMSKAFREKGWRTICVEPNPYYVNEHKKEGNEIYQYAISDYVALDQNFEIIELGAGYENTEFQNGIAYSGIKHRYILDNNFKIKNIKVDIVTLNWLFDYLKIEKIDFVSIDVEGWELDVMRGFDTVLYKPKIILLENYEHNESYNLYMNSIGYTLKNKIQYNYIYELQN